MQRKRRSKNEIQELVACFENSGQTAASWCKENGISSALDYIKGCSKVICQGCKASLCDYGLDRCYAQPIRQTRALSKSMS